MKNKIELESSIKREDPRTRLTPTVEVPTVEECEMGRESLKDIRKEEMER